MRRCCESFDPPKSKTLQERLGYIRKFVSSTTHICGSNINDRTLVSESSETLHFPSDHIAIGHIFSKSFECMIAELTSSQIAHTTPSSLGAGRQGGKATAQSMTMPSNSTLCLGRFRWNFAHPLASEII